MAYPNPPAILTSNQLQSDLLGEKESRLRLYAWMSLARATDNRILELFRQGLIKGTVTGGQGNEGLIVPLALLADKSQDVVSFSHRGLGGHMVWSGHLCDQINQYLANAASPTRAHEGNIHHGDPANRSLPMISHLGSMIPQVLGATDSQRRLGKNAVGIALYGDGASSTGDIHESLNLAALIGLPILFVIENNRYAYSTPVSEQYPTAIPLHERAAGYGIEHFALDTTADPDATAKTFAEALAKVRTSGKPLLIEANTLRLRGHAAYDTCDYLKPGEQDSFNASDPIPRYRAKLVAEGLGSELDQLDAELSQFLEACIKDSLAQPRPTPEGMEALLLAPTADTPMFAAQPDDQEELLNAAQAINHALRRILATRPESMVLGQDIATYGGAFKVTENLLGEFGRPRVFNTPLAESGCTGYAVGLALNGNRPIVEFQFADFSTEAFTQITQNAATYHFRSGAKVPLVLRYPCGGGLTFGSFHSQELEATFLAFPGIKGIYPSTPQDAYNALLAAYEDNNPVIVFEHKALYRRGRQPVKFDPNYRDVWMPRHVLAGTHATLVTYGEMVHHVIEAAEYLATEYEITLDVFDLRALSPLRLEPIEESVARTHRLIVVHEGRLTHGFGAELVSRLTEKLFFQLEAPPLRIASGDLPIPFAPELEHANRPHRDSIIDRIASWLG